MTTGKQSEVTVSLSISTSLNDIFDKNMMMGDLSTINLILTWLR